MLLTSSELGPVQIVELIFPERREEPWLLTRGMAIASVVFTVGAFLAWFLWVKIARIQVFHLPDYKPPIVTLVLGLIAIVVLALIRRAQRHRTLGAGGTAEGNDRRAGEVSLNWRTGAGSRRVSPPMHVILFKHLSAQIGRRRTVSTNALSA